MTKAGPDPLPSRSTNLGSTNLNSANLNGMA